jgi:hypothetical protein
MADLPSAEFEAQSCVETTPDVVFLLFWMQCPFTSSQCRSRSCVCLDMGIASPLT